MVGYVLMAGNRGLRFVMGSDFTVRAWVDAAYGVHSDGETQTSSAITVGACGTVDAKSVKQKIVTKSSTEAELLTKELLRVGIVFNVFYETFEV
jgi:hypothetical protein